MFLGYPGSGRIVKHNVASGPARSIVTNAACGNNSALAKAVLKDTNLKELILVGIINEIKREIRLYSKDPECLLKRKSPADIRKFTNELLLQQLLEKCPKLAIVIASICQPGSLKTLPSLANSDHDNRFRNSVCMATAVCLHQYNQQLMSVHYRISLLLLNGGAKALTVERCAHLGISMSHSSAINMQKKAAAPSTTKPTTWKEDTLAKSLQVNLLEEVLKKQPTSVVVFENNQVEKYDYFDEGVYNECSALLQRATRGHSNGMYPREEIVQAIKEIRKSIVHYK